MKLIFTAVAALSLLICLFFVVATVATFNSSCECSLGHTGQRTRSVAAGYGELRYSDELADFGRLGGTKSTEEHLGYELQKETRPADPRTGEAEAISYQYVISPAYPMVLFAILPLIWVVARMGGRRRKTGGHSDASDEPPAKAP
jgi:hypothetical protein